MSFMMSSPPPGADRGLPRGELLATYASYADAREQVDRLAATDFPVSAVSIVGKDLRVVERVRGRLNYAQVALSAGVRGVFFGGLIGVFLFLLTPEGGAGQILTSMLLGLAVWLIFGVIGFGMRKGRHGFASSQAVVPTGYDLVVADTVNHRLRGVELPLIISDHADWDELLATCAEVQATEVWVTHGRDDALIHALSLRGVRGRALHLIGREEDDDAPEAAPPEEGAPLEGAPETVPPETAPLPAGGGFGTDASPRDVAR